MSDQQAAAAGIVIVLLMFLVVVGGWGALIIFGIRGAKKRNRSPHWMWFGLHPLGALIACIIMNVLPPLRVCPKCAQKFQLQARVCPYCAYSFDGTTAGLGATPA